MIVYIIMSSNAKKYILSQLNQMISLLSSIVLRL
jgi:hypothetical protein